MDIINLFQNIRVLGYKKGSQKNNELEDAIKELLKQNKILFEYQPNGSQQFPDFYLSELKLNMECKSCQDELTTLNSTPFKMEAIYIVSSQKYGCTTFFFGSAYTSVDEIANWEKAVKEIKAFVKEKNETLLANARIEIYPRLKNDLPTSVRIFKDYEQHEQTVLDYFMRQQPEFINERKSIRRLHNGSTVRNEHGGLGQECSSFRPLEKHFRSPKARIILP